MKTFCKRILLITVLLFVSPVLTYGQTFEDRNVLNERSEAGLDTSLEQSLWRFMCPAHIGIGTVKNGTIFAVNDYVTRLLCYSRQELLGQEESMLYPDEHEYALAHSELQKLNSRQEAVSVETRWKVKDGSIRDVHLYSTLLEPGNPSAGIVFTVQDISPRKQADRSFKQRLQVFNSGAIVLGIVLLCLLLFLRRNLKTITHSRQELKIFKDALDNATDAIGMSTPRGRHYYQNRAFDEMFGSIGEYPPDTLYVDSTIGREVFDAILSGGQWTGEVKMYARDRSILDIFLRAYVNKDKNGTIISVLGVHTNITERKQVVIALSESEQKLSNILNTIDDAVVSYSLREDRVVYLSPSFEKIFGIALSDHEKDWHLWIDLVHPDDLQIITDNVACLNEQGFSDQEFRIIRPDGNIAWVRSRSKIIYSETGEPERMDGIITDISDRKQAELALRESEGKLATLFSSMSEIVVLNDLVFNEQGVPVNYRMTDCNRAFVKITGIDRETALGRLATEVYDTDTPPYLEEFSRVALTGQSYRFETYFPPLEKTFSISVVCPAKNSFATITTDITARKQSEEEHTRLQAQLTQAQKIESIGRLAGGVAHDFNNILSVILGYTDMALQDVGSDQPLHADLLEIRNAVNRSSNLTRQLLAFARKQTMAPRILDLNETVEELLKMLRRLIGEDIELAWLPGKNLRAVRIDPSQLDQVLANLCVNARDAIANIGRISIETGNVTLDEEDCVKSPDCVPGDYVLLAVSDDGCGMAGETLPYIFDPFFTTKDIGTGTGLGLSTVYGIVKQNDGCINVDSEPGRGTRFMIYLPQHMDHAEPARDIATPEKPIVRGAETILLVEDESSNLEMYRRMLVTLGYMVLAAATPEECIRLARENAGRIELLLTDVVMPGMNGPDLAKTICSSDPEIKCLFMSGYMDTAIVHGGVLEPGTNLIQKPFAFEELAVRIREVLDGSSDR